MNWCPVDQTVLANEQVIDGHCERCGAEVVRRTLTQWYFKITDYADRLLEDMAQLEGKWPERVLLMQRNWIGRSDGAEVRFVIEGRDEPVTVFTTRPDTLYGATFFVVAADSPLAEELCTPDRLDGLRSYVAEVRKLSDIERQSAERPKTGVFLGRYAINPVNGERIQVWAADYVLSDYGTGAIMAVPAHDQRDLDFARTFGLPVRAVLDTGEPDPAQTGVATAGEGTMVNSGPLDGLPKADAIRRITEILHERGLGKAAVSYRLRDWLVSRQRFWGTPIPIVHCPSCGEIPVPDDQLPVVLPDLRGQDLVPKGVSPLAAAAGWVNVECPKCGGPARRDTDTMDTFVDSSWYFLRYCSPDYEDGPFDAERGAPVVPRRPVRRRRGARHLAPALRAVLHQGALRHGPAGVHRAVHPAAEPGTGDQPGPCRCRSRWETASIWANRWRRTGSTRSGSPWCSPARPRTTSTGPTCRPRRRSSSLAGCGGWRATSPPPGLPGPSARDG